MENLENLFEELKKYDLELSKIVEVCNKIQNKITHIYQTEQEIRYFKEKDIDLNID